ncbi:MAG: hypothetical protein KF905_11850 [Flavobacteriales bacterium]|nr:hypothetical protein [Flavobacteriales bacterium]
MRTIPYAILSIVLISACKKEEPPTAPLPTGPAVTIWTPSFSYTRSGQTYNQTVPSWSFSSASTVQEANGVEYHHALQEAVITNTADPIEQWRIGFVGTFITPGGVLPSSTALGSMAYVNTYFFGRFLWNDTDSSYTVNEGVRVE